MNISPEQYVNMDIPNLLKDVEAWEEATPQGQVAWFTKFLTESGWQQLVDQIMAFGHLLSGAPLEMLAELANMPEPRIHGGDPASYSAIGHHLNHTDFNALRVQELWEALPKKELLWMFFTQGPKLDVAQLIAYYDDGFAQLYNEKPFLDREWLSEDGKMKSVPWSSVMVAGLMHVDHSARATWGEKELLDLGKFLLILYPPQLEEIPTAALTKGVLSSILSPLLTHCQQVVLYNKFTFETERSDLPDLLISAMPSKTILQLESASSTFPQMTWALHKEALVRWGAGALADIA